MKESTLVDNIRKALKKRGVKTLKIHGNAYHEAGTPDIVGCFPELWYVVGNDPEPKLRGRFLALEVKRSEKEEPTDLQKLRLKQWAKAGAVTAVVWSVASAIAAVEGE